MKRIISTLFIVIAFSTASRAFPLNSWGLRGGYTSSSQVWEHDWITEEESSWRSGFHVGLFTEWFDYNNFSLSAGMSYEQKGMGYETYGGWTEPPLEKQTFYSLYHYLSIPVLAKYRLDMTPVSPYLLAGPRLDIFLGYSKDEDHFTWGLEDDFKDLILGMSFGLGLESTTLLNRTIMIEFVYNYDPFWLYEFTNIQTGNESRVKNESYNVSIGIGF